MITTPQPADNALHHARIGVRLRVLAAMSGAMTLFFLALLFIVYHQVIQADSAAAAREVVASLVPWVIVILLICGTGFFLLTNHFVLQPVKKIRDAALAISRGQLDTVISTKGNDEIGDLAGSVAQMADALKKDIARLKEVDALKSEFIAISSHTLRTPLAAIKGGLEVLQSETLNESAKHMLNIIQVSSKDLMTFSEDMLTIANFEANQGAAMRLTPVSLDSAVLTPLAAEMATQKRGVTLSTNFAAAQSQIQANVPLLRLAFRNILDNAYKFTSAGGITIASKQQEGRVVVQVIDSGVGIASDELPNLFTKFHRGTDTLTYNYEGAGVGLYMAKLIFDQHHATITVSSVPGKGTTVTVSLPSLPPTGQSTES